MSKKSLKEKILASEDIQPEPVEIPEWGIGKGEAFLRPLDGDSRYKIGQLASGTDLQAENAYIAEAYVCESLFDEKGEQAFEFEDRALLAKKDPAVVERLYRRISELSGIDDTAEGDAEKK